MQVQVLLYEGTFRKAKSCSLKHKKTMNTMNMQPTKKKKKTLFNIVEARKKE